MSVNAATVQARRHLHDHRDEGLGARLNHVAALKAQGVYVHLSNSDAWFADRIVEHLAAGRLPAGIFAQGAGDSPDNPGDLTIEQCELLSDLLTDEHVLGDVVASVGAVDDDEIEGAVKLLGQVAVLAQLAAGQGGLSVR
jgi:hypothetical protein